MVIEAFILCYNEERMIRHTLNHYTKFCERITIIDNNSTDDSINLAKKHYPNVNVEFFDSGGQYREDLQINIRNNCWKNSRADYVIVCDMDEFLYAPNIRQQLTLMKENDVIIPIVYGYNMVSETFPGSYETDITEQVKVGFRERFLDKSIIFNPSLVKEINYGPGSHFCQPILTVENRIDQLVDFKLLHYKFLSKEYLYNKHTNYAERMSEINKQRGFGREYLLGAKYIDDTFRIVDKYLYKIIN